MILAFPGIEDNFFTLTLFLQNLANALANGAVYSLMALTVVMIYKTTGHLNFAQGEMAMFTTFIVFVLAVEQGWPVSSAHSPRWKLVTVTLVPTFASPTCVSVAVRKPRNSRRAPS